MTGKFRALFESIRRSGINVATDRGPFAILEALSVDGNVADVYGETAEDARETADAIVAALNRMPALTDHVHRWRIDWDERAAICDGCPDAEHMEGPELEEALNECEIRSAIEVAIRTHNYYRDEEQEDKT